MSNNRSDDFDTMSFEPIRPGNPNYEQYFNKPIDAGDLSDFEDEPMPTPANNGYYPPEEDYDDPYENYSVDDDYYAAEPAYNYDGLAKGTVIAIAAIMGSIIIAVIIMFAVTKSDKSNQSNGPIPYTTSTAATTEATTSQVSTAQTTTSTTKETTTTETETTSTTEATTTKATTEATTEVSTTTETVATTKAPTTQPPATTQATTELTTSPTEAPPTTEPLPVTTPETDPGPGDDVVDLDPEIPGIQAPW